MARKKPAGPLKKKKEATRWNDSWNPAGPSKEEPRSLFLECEAGHTRWRWEDPCKLCQEESNGSSI